MIFKVQLPLFTTAKEPYGLVYNREKTIVFHPPIEQIQHLFNKEEKKIYMYGVWDEKDPELLRLTDRAPQQDW